MQALFDFLSDLVLFLTLTTLVFALGAYAAMVLRRRKPRAARRAPDAEGEIVLLRRYIPRETP